MCQWSFLLFAVQDGNCVMVVQCHVALWSSRMFCNFLGVYPCAHLNVWIYDPKILNVFPTYSGTGTLISFPVVYSRREQCWFSLVCLVAFICQIPRGQSEHNTVTSLWKGIRKHSSAKDLFLRKGWYWNVPIPKDLREKLLDGIQVNLKFHRP